MSQWIERIKSHQVWNLIEAFSSSIEAAGRRENLNSEMLDSISRIKAALTLAARKLSSIDPILLPFSVLDSLSPSLNNMKANVDTFIVNGDQGQLNSANSQVEV